ncbi:MAG: Ig domain-containing protein, partial [Bacteroidales bacterium]|nr:Ig domain-containing protein [Bacteroidales bacterium]
DNATNKVVTWTSSDNEVATVDENGNVTAVSIGTATITATTTDGSDLSASCIVTVLPILATAIELDQDAVSIIAEKSTTLTATVLPGNTTNKAVVWSTSDENIATVEDGVVTAISVGTATITATTTDGSNLSATCEVTVEQKMVKLIMQNSYYNNVIFFLLPGTEQKIQVVNINPMFVLNTVMFNDENVTEQLVDGVYTTPALEEDAVINISYDIPTAENTPSENSRIKAYGYKDDIVVIGCERGETIAIYDVDGVMLRSVYATSDTMRIAMPTDAVYVVQVSNVAVKVAL